MYRHGAVPLGGVTVRIVQADGADTLVLTLIGELTQLNAPDVRRYLLERLAEQPTALVCDLGQLQPVEPLALTLFSAVALQAAHWPGAPVALCRANPPVGDLLQRLGVHQGVYLRDTLAQALTVARQRRQATVRKALLLPADPTSARLARALVAAATTDLADDLADDAVLLAGELVTNAVNHARTETVLHVALGGKSVRIAVADSSPELPHRLPRPVSEAGRGLYLLDSLATAWGALRTASGGKLVWCLLRG
jgi:anti-anti-sigma regulatory factor/anti-sigma regulatory factor (Ser/Thr protein kinase)